MKDIATRKPVSRLPERQVDPFGSLFDDVLAPFGLAPRAFGLWREEMDFMPRVDVHETDKELKVTAELPGIEEKDVKVELEENALILSGEKKEEHEEKSKHGYRLERHYGSFHRVIPLPTRVEGDKAKAEFRKGVLTVTIPRTEEARKHIEIKVG